MSPYPRPSPMNQAAGLSRPAMPVKRGSPRPGMLSAAFHEVKHNPPGILAHTAAKFGAADARRQAIAIALSKARRGY